MSGNTRKNQVTRLVTLRHRSTMSGALRPWTATSMLAAALTAPLLLAVTVNSRPGPGLGRGGRRPRRCSRNALRVHPPGAPADPRGALSALSLDAAKITVNAAALGTRFR